MSNELRMFIGAPILTNERDGYIVGIDSEAQQFIIVWSAGEFHYISFNRIHDIQNMIKCAFDKGMKKISELEASTKCTNAIMDILESKKIFEKNQREKEKLTRDWDELVKNSVSSKFKSVIIAKQISREMQMDDYVEETTHDTVILCLSESTWDNFKEMRKAALLSDKTSFLFNAGHEHREKYSGGKGYYLSETERGTGWIIKKKFFFNGQPDIPVGEMSEHFTKQLGIDIEDEVKQKEKEFSIDEISPNEVIHINTPKNSSFLIECDCNGRIQ